MISSIVKLRWDRLVFVIVPINIVKFEIMIGVPARALSIGDSSTQPGTVIGYPVIWVIQIILYILLSLEEQPKH